MKLAARGAAGGRRGAAAPAGRRRGRSSDRLPTDTLVPSVPSVSGDPVAEVATATAAPGTGAATALACASMPAG